MAQSQTLDPYPALSNGNYFSVNQSGDSAGSLSTPGLDLPPPNLATVNLPTFTELSGASAAFVYGSVGGATLGAATGVGIGLYLAPSEIAEFATAARVGYGVGQTSPLWAPLVGIDTVSGLGFAGALGGMAAGGGISLVGYGVYRMSQLQSPASGPGYGYPYGNFSPF